MITPEKPSLIGMTPAQFRQRRRQKYLTLEYFKLNKADLQQSLKNFTEGIQYLLSKGDYDPANQASLFKRKLDILRLHYTAGEPIDSLIPIYHQVLEALGDWHEADHVYSEWLAQQTGENLRTDMTPLELEDLGHYQLTLDVVSLGLLLGQGDAVRQIASWMQSARGTDVLLEFLFSAAVDPIVETNRYFHQKPYDPLIEILCLPESSPQEESAKMQTYLGNWYKSFEGMPWHNGHLLAVPGEYMPYYGYWAFEAAAVAVILKIDDASFRDHILYPKDLADWARQHDCIRKVEPQSAPADNNPESALRCEGGQPCPQTGWWFTPAQTGSRRYAKAGDILPVIESTDYGHTFWQWDPDQTFPSL